MNKIVRSVLLMACLYPVAKTSAQNDIDAVRYSQSQMAATARSLSLGNAFGALGADFSTLSTNPAGIAVYKRSEFSFTPVFGNTSTESSLFGKKSTDNKYNFNIGNLGLVYAYPKDKKNSGWKGWAFGIGYNKLNSFHARSIYEAVNPDNSLLDSYVESANGISYDQLPDNDPFGSDLGFQTYLIDTLPGTTDQYFSAIPNGGALQRRTKESRGSLGEVAISFGGNYNDKVYWGVTLGFPYVRYHEDVIYEEIDQNDTIDHQNTPWLDSSYAAYFNFKSFSLNQSLATTGNGFQAKFGLIIRPNDFLRIGAAIHSPAFYDLHDEYVSTINARFESGSLDPYQSPLGIYDYSLTTPFKAIGSVALIYQQQGVLGFEYEFVDYTTAKLDASDYAFTDENRIIRDSYTQGHNFRAGAEWKYNIFAFRLGAGYYGGVLKSNVSSKSTDQHKFIYSGGIGIREESYFVDIGYAYTTGNEFYRPYFLESENVEGVFSKITDHKLLLTIGFRF